MKKQLPKELKIEKFSLRQIYREDVENPTDKEIGFAIYEKTREGHPHIGYETIRIRAYSDHYRGDQLIEAAEFYPGNSEWGVHGLTTNSKKEALAAIEKLKGSKKEEKIIWPTKKFTVIDLASLNGISKAKAYLLIKDNGKNINVVGTIKTGGRGKPSLLYSV